MRVRMSASNAREWGTHVLKLFSERRKKNNVLTSESAQVLFTWRWIYWKLKIKTRTIWRRLKSNSIYSGAVKTNFNGSFECVMWLRLPEKTTIYWSNNEKKNKTSSKYFFCLIRFPVSLVHASSIPWPISETCILFSAVKIKYCVCVCFFWQPFDYVKICSSIWSWPEINERFSH